MEKEERLEIQSRYPKLDFPDPVLEPVWKGKRPTELISGRYAIYNQKDNSFYSFCTDQYKLVHHEEIVKMVEETVKKFPEYGEAIITPRLYKDGAMIAVKATFPDVEFEVRKGDILNPTMDAFSSVDCGKKLLSRQGVFRVICSNGAMIGEILSKYSKRHLLSVDLEEMEESLKVGMTMFSEQQGLWKRWVETKVSLEKYEKIWEVLPFSTAEREKIEKLPETQTRLLLPDAVQKDNLSVWDLNNVLTQFVTHELKSEERRINIAPKIARVMETIH